MKSSVMLKIENNKINIKVYGVIDEEIKFSNYPLCETSSMVFDFIDAKGINSCGIREWIRWITPFAHIPMTYKNCPKIIVDQINMVDGFLPAKGMVESFYVPYYSEESDEEKHILYTFGKEFTADEIFHPTQVLDSHKKPMELDVIESKYFRFLQKIPKSA